MSVCNNKCHASPKLGPQVQAPVCRCGNVIAAPPRNEGPTSAVGTADLGLGRPLGAAPTATRPQGTLGNRLHPPLRRR